MSNHWTVYAFRWAVIIGMVSAIALGCVSLYWYFTRNNGIDYKDLDATYTPYNSVRASDTEEIDKILTCLSSFYESINQSDFKCALAVLDSHYIAENKITEQSLKVMYENKYRTAVDYEILGDSQIGNKVILWVSETNQRLGEEDYSESELFNYRTVISYDIDSDRISLDGFLYSKEVMRVIPIGVCKVKVRSVTVRVDSTVVKLDVTNEGEVTIDNPIRKVFLNSAGGSRIEAGRMPPGWGISIEPGETRTGEIDFGTNYSVPPSGVELFNSGGEKQAISFEK